MKKLTILSILILVFGVAVGQDNQTVSLQKNWETLLDKSEDYQHYKVIKKTSLDDFWKVVQDSLAQYQATLQKAAQEQQSQARLVSDLKSQVAQAQEKMDIAISEKDSMIFLGIEIEKYTYALSLWLVVGALIVFSCLLFYLYNSSNRITKEKIRDYQMLLHNYEDLKTKKIEMERKLKRELQTNMNRIEELEGKV